MTPKELKEFDPLDFSRLDAMIAAAPESVPPTPEEIEAAKIEAQRKALAARVFRAIGPRTGWPARYLEAVSAPPHGSQWLAAMEVAEETVRKNGIAVFYGLRGTGKTRMAAELSVIAGDSRYRTAMRFFLDVRATFRRDSELSEKDVLDDLTETPLLVLDEIQERGETSFEDRLLTHLIDARYGAMRPTIMIANLTKKELASTLGPSIVSRAQENGKSIEFIWDSYRAKP